MRQNYTYNLVFILILVVAVVWLALPSNVLQIGGRKPSGTPPLGLDLVGGLRVLLEVDLPAGQTISNTAIPDAVKILNQRANGLGVSGDPFQQVGTNRIVGEFPGLSNTTEVISAIRQTGVLAFVPMGSNPEKEGATVQVDVTDALTAPQPTPTGQPAPTLTPAPTATATPSVTPTPGPTATPAPTVYKALMTGNALSSVSVSRDTLGKYAVDFVLKPEWSTVFADFTSKHVGEYLVIVLDNVVISAPTINGAITGGSGQISGSFTQDSANQLAVNLRYGSLPVPLKISQSQAVGATLGQDSIRKSVVAGVIGLSMVILFMIIYYRLPGFLASLALLLYAATTYGLFKLIGVTLTLPGIAGFVLSIGVAVDANILIFSRMKEELKAGRTLRQAIDLGWGRAWPSIRDSNISTLITCVILFVFGTTYGASIVAGFAVTLFLGVMVSLFTAIFVTRTLLHTVIDNLEFTKHPSLFGV